MERMMTRPWKPWQAGIAIGLLGALAYLSSAASGRNYPLGVTHGVLHAGLLVTDSNLKHVYRKPEKTEKSTAADRSAAARTVTTGVTAPKRPEVAPAQKKVVWWLILLVTGLMAGSWTAGRMSGETRLLPKPPEQTVIALLGGVVLGSGAGIAKGCVVGNMLSGIGLMSAGLFLFVFAAILANWVTSWFYLMGGSFYSRKQPE